MGSSDPRKHSRKETDRAPRQSDRASTFLDATRRPGWKRWWSFLLPALLAACATIPEDYVRLPSSAWDRPLETKMGREWAKEIKSHPGQSGFVLLGSGMDAFISRMALAHAAERTLDLQYYIFEPDLTGKLLLDAILTAADRGVRVRILIDDVYTSGKDFGMAAYASHPGIELRVFNPFAGRSGLRRLLSSIRDFGRVNQRMHNKMFVADNQAGVAGGRNIGDIYFSARPDVNYADVDLLAVGPVVQDLSGSFDDYWNSDWSVPVEAFLSPARAAEELETVREALKAHREAMQESEYARRFRESDFLKRLLAGNFSLVWAPAHVVFDKPEKAEGAGRSTGSVRLGPTIRPYFEAARSEVLLTSPYFVPGEEGVDFCGKLRERGVRVRILTNSFAANDVAMVHSGYARYREPLLERGVELHEIKPALTEAPEGERKYFGSAGSSLHAKTFVIDRRVVFVGSMNLDPRSAYLNTELGIVVESPELAKAVAAGFEKITAPEYSYQVEREHGGNGLVWVSEEEGREVRYSKDPGVGFWRRFSTGFLSLFVPESLL